MSPLLNSRRSNHLAVGLWIAFAIAVVLVRLGAEPTPGNVFNIYREAALRWQQEQALHDGRFLYLPTFAQIFAPFSWLPFAVGGAFWRLINLSIFALGVASYSKQARVDPRDTFLKVTIVCLPLTWSAARHGQATLAMGGLMMLGITSLARHRLWRAGFLLTMAVAIKPLAIVAIPAVWSARRATLIPLLLWGVFWLATPFALHEASYVSRSFAGMIEAVQQHAATSSQHAMPELFGLFDSLGIHFSRHSATAVRVLMGLGVLGLCTQRCRGSSLQSGRDLYAIVCAFLLLCSPSTENNTYALIAPVLGYAFVLARRERLTGPCVILAAAFGLFLASYELGKLFPGSCLEMCKPIATIALAAVLWRLRIAPSPGRRHKPRSFGQRVDSTGREWARVATSAVSWSSPGSGVTPEQPRSLHSDQSRPSTR